MLCTSADEVDGDLVDASLLDMPDDAQFSDKDGATSPGRDDFDDDDDDLESRGSLHRRSLTAAAAAAAAGPFAHQLGFPHGAAVKAESMCLRGAGGGPGGLSPGAVGLSPPVGGTATAAAGGCCPGVKTERLNDVESNCSSAGGGGVDASKDMAKDKENNNTTGSKVGARSQ